MQIISLFLCLIISACNFISDPDKKMFIKSVQSEDLVVDWYIYSIITNFSPAKIQIEKDGNTYQVIEFGHGISDISLINNTLIVQTSRKPEFEIHMDVLKKVGLKIIVDTTGKQWNESSSRFGRLQRKNVDYSRRHFVETNGTSFGD